ncbi:SLIT and NTRK-like protein 4 [Pristis pectinata]|uniref:SLIT and NTRK-like protein 4 n=1 Tax=Pristis pectinata TaxID=685728 RepID=UPI00223CDBBD|nr:SLIT and NTRK-like protein 4 [Pristis pectinata]
MQILPHILTESLQEGRPAAEHRCTCAQVDGAKMLLFVLLTLSVPAISLSSEPDVKEICSVCSCTPVEHILYISCEGISMYRPNQLRPPAANFYHLNLQNNLLISLAPYSFANFTNAISLQLGNNKLQEIEAGAFRGLSGLKQLHLNNNELQVLRADIFQGLENLEYLQTDYNLIKSIERGAFNKMHKLKVLILNDNLISWLPDNIFRFASLTHLDLRGNRLQNIPYIGVLEHVGRIVEFQLADNPWNCSCDLLPLTSWLDNMPYHLYIGEAMCEVPANLYGKLLKELTKRDLCPEDGGGSLEPTVPPPLQLVPRGTRRSTLPTDSSRRSQSGIASGKFLSSSRNYSQIAPFQTKVPPQVLCPARCVCQSQALDLGMSVSCQERGIENVSTLMPRPPSARKLFLNGNYIRDIEPSDFADYEGLDLLHLGNNQITVLQKGVFSNLTNLRRLYLNGNQLGKVCKEIFIGLQNLQYLFLEYNMIKEVLPGTFDSMSNLQLLDLNNNLLKSLPAYAFAGVPLARLNLRNNHFMYLPVSGVLDQLRSLTQIDLEGNPWDCTCDLVALKLWVEKLHHGTLVREVKCETPVKFAGVNLTTLKSEVLCPRLLNKPAVVSPNPESPAASKSTPLNLAKSSPGGPVPLSILILSILVVLILTVFVAFCLLVFVLQRHKKTNPKQEGGNPECGLMQPHFSKSEPALSSVPQTIEEMTKNYAGTGRSCEHGLSFGESQGQTIFLRNISEKEKEAVRSDKKRLSTIEELDELLPARDSHLFYRDVMESKPEMNSLGVGGFELKYPEKQQDAKKLKKSLLGSTHPKMVVELSKGEYFELKAKLQGSPDYLQVLEEQTALSQI